MSHKIAHVSDSPLNAKTSRPDAVVCRGPIDGPTAERLGLSSEVESRLIQPAAPEVARAAEAVLKLVPKNVLPVEGDTAESLVARLESSDWLDGMEVKEGGHGKGGRYVLLNSEEYPQPRRKSWNAVADTSLPCAPTRQTAELPVHGTEMHSRALQSYLSGSGSRPVTLRIISFH